MDFTFYSRMLPSNIQRKRSSLRCYYVSDLIIAFLRYEEKNYLNEIVKWKICIADFCMDGWLFRPNAGGIVRNDFDWWNT